MLMTAITAGLVGGLISSTVLDIVITPLVFYRYGEPALKNTLLQTAAMQLSSPTLNDQHIHMKKQLALFAILSIVTIGCSKSDTDESAATTTQSSEMKGDTAGMNHGAKMDGQMNHGAMSGGSMEEKMAMMNAEMAGHLGQPDANYDHRFIDMMIPHHEGALLMAKDAMQKSQRPEIKEMAQEMITAQEKEIVQLKAWREAWYRKH